MGLVDLCWKPNKVLVGGKGGLSLKFARNLKDTKSAKSFIIKN